MWNKYLCYTNRHCLQSEASNLIQQTITRLCKHHHPIISLMAAAGTLMVFTVLLARLLGGLTEEDDSETPLFLGGGVLGKGTDPFGGPTVSVLFLNVVLRGRVDVRLGWTLEAIEGFTRCSLARDFAPGELALGRVPSAKIIVEASRSMSTMTLAEDAWWNLPIVSKLPKFFCCWSVFISILVLSRW